jgi:hypothetical protein
MHVIIIIYLRGNESVFQGLNRIQDLTKVRPIFLTYKIGLYRVRILCGKYYFSFPVGSLCPTILSAGCVLLRNSNLSNVTHLLALKCHDSKLAQPASTTRF